MTPEIVEVKEIKLIGMSVITTFAENKTRELWQQFMPRRNEISYKLDRGYYSVQIYEHSLRELEPDDVPQDMTFQKWAAVEVTDISQVPAGMQSHIISGGTYAVFIHKGLHSTFPETLQYIFNVWLPASEYELDDREHFEIMGEKYLGPDNPDSEEEIWIPIK